MSKYELVEYVSTKTGLTKADAGRALEATLEGITSSLKKSEKVTLIGFGSFEAKKRAAREGINPLNKKPIKIPAKIAATFKAGKKLKEALN